MLHRLQYIGPQNMPLIKCPLDTAIRTALHPLSDGPFGSREIFCPDATHPFHQCCRVRKTIPGDLLTKKPPKGYVLPCHTQGYRRLVTTLCQLFPESHHSVRKLFTGLDTAAFIAWKLTVAIVMTTASTAVPANTHGLMLIR